MGESQWFQPTVKNGLDRAIILTNFCIKYGKFYDIHNKYEETNSAEGTKIESNAQFEWGHCGRYLSPTGTEGSFEIHLEESGDKIAEIYWDCSYTGNHKLKLRDVTGGYNVSFRGFNLPNGLEEGEIKVSVDKGGF